MYLNKRGEGAPETISYYTLIHLVLVLVVISGLVLQSKRVQSDKTFEKKFVAMDLSLLTSIVASSPDPLIYIGSFHYPQYSLHHQKKPHSQLLIFGNEKGTPPAISPLSFSSKKEIEFRGSQDEILPMLPLDRATLGIMSTPDSVQITQHADLPQPYYFVPTQSMKKSWRSLRYLSFAHKEMMPLAQSLRVFLSPAGVELEQKEFPIKWDGNYDVILILDHGELAKKTDTNFVVGFAPTEKDSYRLAAILLNSALEKIKDQKQITSLLVPLSLPPLSIKEEYSSQKSPLPLIITLSTDQDHQEVWNAQSIVAALAEAFP